MANFGSSRVANSATTNTRKLAGGGLELMYPVKGSADVTTNTKNRRCGLQLMDPVEGSANMTTNMEKSPAVDLD